MSVKFEAKFKSLLESLVDYTLIDDIKAKTFHNKHRKKCVYYHFLGGITTEANFDLILSFDIECSQIIILFLSWLSIDPVHSKTELIYKDAQKEFRICICCTLSINIVMLVLTIVTVL